MHRQHEPDLVAIVSTRRFTRVLTRLERKARKRKTAVANLVINCYRSPSSLFVGGSTLISEEGTTQGEPLSTPLYALATIPLINRVSLDEGTNQVWHADDSAAVGHLTGLRKWFDSLESLGPSYGYYVSEEKTWLVVKPDYLN